MTFLQPSPSSEVYPDPPQSGPPARDERKIAAALHGVTFLGVLLPLANLWSPLLLWRLHYHRSTFIDEHAKEVLNFQLNVTWWCILSIVTIGLYIGWLIMIAVLALVLFCTLKAVWTAYEGHYYRYPSIRRFLR